MQVVIVEGNPIDGLTLTGPFEDPEEATGWKEQQSDSKDWWVAELYTPFPDEGRHHFDYNDYSCKFCGKDRDDPIHLHVATDEEIERSFDANR